MELQPVPPDELLPPTDLSMEETSESLAPLRKRQRQNLQDVSNTKPLAPLRASGRIRIKMSAAAELKPPEPAMKPIKVLNNGNVCSSNKQRRKPKKLKTDLVSELAIDVKRPSSVLVDTSIRALLTNVAFSQLSPESQKILIESLPLVDRPTKENHGVDLNPSSINNEFFNRACIEWRDRLSNGEFTNEHQTKLRAEQEREKSKIDPWKARNFEGIWGIKSNGHGVVNVGAMMEKSAMEMKERVEQGDFEIPEGYIDEMWKRDEVDSIDEIKVDDNQGEENWKSVSPPFHSPSQYLSVSTFVPTPPETVTSTQLESSDAFDSNPSTQLVVTMSHKPLLDQPIIAEATSSADDAPLMEKDSPPQSLSSDLVEDDDYAGDIASHVELSSEGVQMRWYHQQEHDYLKNVEEPEPSGMDEIGASFDNGNVESEVEDINEDNSPNSEMISEDDAHNYNVSRLMTNVSRIVDASSRINNYDTELPQEIFHKPEDVAMTFKKQSTNVIVNNYMQHPLEAQPVVIRQVMEPSTTTRFNHTAMIKPEEQCEPTTFHHDNFVMDETEIEDTRTYRGDTSEHQWFPSTSDTRVNKPTVVSDEIHMNVAKNVKLLAFPSGIKYNDKYIIEEHQPHQQQQHIHQPTSSFRTNGTTSIQPASYFVGGTTNFAYISKMGTKVEAEPPSRIIKQESNNNQGQMKQRIIYEIATEPKVTYEQPSTHHVTYTSQPHQEIFHQMVKHPNGTTTIYETTATPKKTVIQRKKTADPYTVQVVANNNTIILTPIGNTGQQNVQQQPQKSIVHIHRSAPMMQTSQAPPVQFLTAPPSYLKKQTVIHPQMSQKPQTSYTTVIRTPLLPAQTQQQLQQQLQQVQQVQQVITTTGSSKIQRPIQKQKVIMSTSSLQQYRSYSQKPAGHGSRKQLHPQHIVRPTPSTTTTTTTVIHQQMAQEQKPNQIPVLLPTGSVSSNLVERQCTLTEQRMFELQNDHVIMTSPMTMSSQQICHAPSSVVIGPPPGINNIYVRPKRPQQIFHPAHQHLTSINNMMTTVSNVSNISNVQGNISNVQGNISNVQGNISNVQGNISNIQGNISNVQGNISNVQGNVSCQQNNQQIIATQPPRMRQQQNQQRPPPGTVNLERSYQICQAVIQNSANPNRQQLNNQLKPPPHVIPHVMKKF